jgi:hypothetical protein
MFDQYLHNEYYYWVKIINDPENKIEIALFKDDNFYFCGYDAPVHRDKVKAIGSVINPYCDYHDVEQYYLDDEYYPNDEDAEFI